MVKWRLFVEQRDNGYLNFRVSEHSAEDITARLVAVMHDPKTVRFTVSRVSEEN